VQRFHNTPGDFSGLISTPSPGILLRTVLSERIRQPRVRSNVLRIILPGYIPFPSRSTKSTCECSFKLVMVTGRCFCSNLCLPLPPPNNDHSHSYHSLPTAAVVAKVNVPRTHNPHLSHPRLTPRILTPPSTQSWHGISQN
jgi:hypothetical protein